MWGRAVPGPSRGVGRREPGVVSCCLTVCVGFGGAKPGTRNRCPRDPREVRVVGRSQDWWGGRRRGGQADAEAPEEGVLLAAKEGACAAAADEDGGSCSHWVGLVSGNLAARKDRGCGHLTLAFPMDSFTRLSIPSPLTHESFMRSLALSLSATLSLLHSLSAWSQNASSFAAHLHRKLRIRQPTRQGRGSTSCARSNALRKQVCSS